MSNANSITLEEISCFNLLGEKKKVVSLQTIAKKIPKKVNFSTVTNHPEQDLSFSSLFPVYLAIKSMTLNLAQSWLKGSQV